MNTAASISPSRLLREAAALVSETHENPEYDRALIELVTYSLGGSVADGDGEQVASWLGYDSYAFRALYGTREGN